MKRKFIAVLLIFVSMTFNAYAEENNNVETSVNVINYSSIDDLILSRNTTVKTNQNAIDKLGINYNSLRDAEDDIEDAIEEMEDLLLMYKGQVEADGNQGSSNINLGSQEESINLNDPIIKDIYSNINKIKLLLKNMNYSNIANLEKSIDSMEDQLENINRQQIDMAKLIDKMKVQTEMINNQMIWTGESLIFAYDSIKKEEKNIDKNLIVLENQLKVLNVRKSLGFITEVDIEGIKLSIEELDYAKEILNNQKENIKRQLNLIIGQPYDTSIDIIFNPVLNDDKLDSVDRTKDLELALDNNYNINLQECEIAAKETALKRAKDDHGKNSAEYKLAKEDLEDAQLKMEDTKRAQQLKFQQIYENVKDKQKVIALEDKKLAQEKVKVEASEVKYNLGIISKVECDNAKSYYDLQAIKVESAKKDLFTVYRNYEWIIEGLET